MSKRDLRRGYENVSASDGDKWSHNPNEGDRQRFCSTWAEHGNRHQEALVPKLRDRARRQGAENSPGPGRARRSRSTREGLMRVCS